MSAYLRKKPCGHEPRLKRKKPFAVLVWFPQTKSGGKPQLSDHIVKHLENKLKLLTCKQQEIKTVLFETNFNDYTTQKTKMIMPINKCNVLIYILHLGFS